MATETKITHKASIKYGSLPLVTLSNLENDVDDQELYQFADNITKLMIPQENGLEVKKRYEYQITQ